MHSDFFWGILWIFCKEKKRKIKLRWYLKSWVIKEEWKSLISNSGRKWFSNCVYAHDSALSNREPTWLKYLKRIALEAIKTNLSRCV